MSLWVYECQTCTYIDEDTEEELPIKVERLTRGKRRRPNPLCHVCGKKMKWIKYPGANFELKGGGWSK